MKKIICVMIIGTLLICTFFAGCGKAEDGKVSDTNPNSGTNNNAESMLTNASENVSSGVSEVSSDLSSAASDLSSDLSSAASEVSSDLTSNPKR